MFLNDAHKQRYIELIKESGCYDDDHERKQIFYILAGNIDLYSKRNAIYDFKSKDHVGGCINPDCFEKVDFCSSSRKLVTLAFNLYNNFETTETTVNLFSGLDCDNFILAINALRIRFPH